MIYFSLISQEISKRIPLRMHANSQDSTKETLLSQDVAVSLLQENKMALRRCELVSKSAYIYNLVSLNRILFTPHIRYRKLRTLVLNCFNSSYPGVN